MDTLRLIPFCPAWGKHLYQPFQWAAATCLQRQSPFAKEAHSSAFISVGSVTLWKDVHIGLEFYFLLAVQDRHLSSTYGLSNRIPTTAST